MSEPEIADILRSAVSRNITRAHTAYRLRLLAVFMEKGVDLTPDMYFILRHLWGEQDGCRQQELADKTDKDKASLTKLVDNLEKRGLVRRSMDGEDRRSKRVWLTPVGKDLKEIVYPLALQVVATAENGVDQEDIQRVKQTLDALVKNLKRG
ncbi:transcriptional regulator, MarR family [Chitinophaga jiangningensis]|uniref:Transcriptional regulator, MarR family n=1 Tax=Chitinophaga jiangningensis TaxID=1419482 RepID=A0A1M7AVM5_9BACT|nr:MarR family winged helix-turn-helix transcriptional regulator [Chitinophaga jiangningensis]SHL46838.1 transcriptional regulator, MarR family [Chitinophaga jiangningensis]